MKSKMDGISSSSNPMSKIWNSLWNLKNPPKTKHFCWKALNNTLPTKVNLKYRGIDTSLVCPSCSNYVETTDHILFQCDHAKEIWKRTFDRVYLDTHFNGSFGDRWEKICSSCSPSELGLVVVACWAIWTDRNKRVHDESIPSVEVRSKWIAEYLVKYSEANPKIPVAVAANQRFGPNSSNDCWSPPPEGVWKFNTDAAWSSSPPATGIGVIGRNSAGRIVGAAMHALDLNLERADAELRGH